jgi:hypothetical protein
MLGRLQTRGIGCQWLTAAWAALGQTLQAHGELTRPEMARMLNLLGENNLPQADHPLAGVWSAGLALLPERDPADQALPAPEAARVTLAEFIKAEHDRLLQRSQGLWAEVDGPELNNARNAVLFDTSDDADKMARYERANAAEVHKCLNTLAKKRREEGRAADSENRAKSAANRVAQAVSSSNGNGHEPFVMPQPLAGRLAENVALQPAEAGSENRPTAADVDVATPYASTHSGNAPGGVADSPAVVPTVT